MRRRSGWLLGQGFGLLMVAGGTVAYGQTAAPPALLNQVPQASPIPHILPKAPPNLGRSLPNFQPLGQEGAVPHAAVPVRSAAVIGATAFPASVLAHTIGPLVGPAVPLASVEAARLRLVSLYRDHGFVLTAVSAEINAGGDLRFIVTEGHIVTVKLSRDIGPVGSLVLKFLDHLTRERPVREASLEHWLLLAEEIPGVSVTAVLQRNDAAPGALTLVAEVRHQQVSGLLTADNRGFRETGPAEGLAVADVNSMTALGDQTQISLFHTSGSTNNFGQAAESFFVGASGLRIGVYAGAGRSQPSGVLREIGYKSYLEVFGINASYPLLLRRGDTLAAKLSLDGTQNLIDTASGIGGGEAATSSDSVRAIRFELNEAFTDDALGGDRVALTTASLLLSKGVSILGASANGRTNAGRVGETFTFFKLDGAIERTQTLFSPFAGATVAVQGALGGQYTPDVLPSSEEFYLGGNRIAQGYYSGEVTGDKALYASAEVQLNTPVDFTAFGRQINLGSQFYGFYDYGENWQNDKLLAGETHNNYRLASAGIGARFRLTATLEFDIEGVHRFVTRLQPVNSGVAPLSGTAVYWGVVARY
ncbi:MULTISPECIES: ShlB/FhaC/HecB family hemolysin secretion/activation protein [Acidiphilium]|uniref:ShlB/FhaC/HecB family hemolysin secretion/activation protein n=1 Tax=Acidiphilium TaxID=522 RepID=UPI00257ACC6C|nr:MULTISPECIES: ShlB/FhaC/HecB family hemolysin secretion/activation protein [Acidiphilium]HQT85685.1 ShlB/FhaC/HecB family hemolysin secretion/activation protein [Acidiphilium rubrum]